LEEQERAERAAKATHNVVASLERKGMVLENLAEVKLKSTDEQLAVLSNYEEKQKLKDIVVPTDDGQVRKQLQVRAEPQCLFGEGPAERRDRLRALLSDHLSDGLDVAFEDSASDDEDDDNEEFYSYGTDHLLPCRRFLTTYSLSRAKSRVSQSHSLAAIPPASQKRVLRSLFTSLRAFDISASQFGDTRPLCAVRFSPCSKLIATGSFSGPVRLWNVNDATQHTLFKGHRNRTCSIDFFPGFQAASRVNDTDSSETRNAAVNENGRMQTDSDNDNGRMQTDPENNDNGMQIDPLETSGGGIDLVSGGIDGSVLGFRIGTETPVAQFIGHEDQRVSRVAFHPCGKFMATASFDQTWRLWDVETQAEILCQEGHSRELFALGFQQDGSLVCSGGKDGIGRVWDLRSGRSVVILQGHAKGILDLDWSPNGHQLATASEDHTIRIWDMRGKGSGCLTSIPAHSNLVSSVRYFNASSDFKLNSRQAGGGGDDEMMDIGDEEEVDTRRALCSGSYLVSSSYDGTCKVWTSGDFKPIKTFTGIEKKVMACDVSRDGKHIATASYDRTFKIYE
ncbi:MAG: hypothetical protein SGCHY_004167, partial [Lobulomycetales sp.]